METLRDRRRSMAWWTAGLIALVVLTLIFYPSIRDSSGLNDYTKDLSETMRALFVGGELDITSAVGYLNSQIFAFVAPLLLMILSVGMGAALIAGDEERGTLDYLLAQPVTRTSVVVQRLVAMIICTTAAAAVIWVTILAVAPLIDLEIGFTGLVAATLSCALLAILYGTLALAIGAFAAGRGRAIGIAGALAVAAWILDGLGQAVDALEPFRPLSPFYQALGHTPLRDGAPWGGWALLAAATAVFAVAAAVGLNRRDLRQ